VPTVADEKEVKPAKQRKIPLQQSFVLRCMVYPNKPGEYTAECIDLDIMVRASTPQEALHDIRAAIRGYLTVVLAGDTAGLLPRPSPLSHRIRYHSLVLRAALTFGIRRTFLVSDLSASDLCSC
jgi:hypothetical protein